MLPNLEWKISSSCDNGKCVEVARVDDVNGSSVAVRNSTTPDLVIMCSSDEWQAFIGGVKNGEFDFA